MANSTAGDYRPLICGDLELSDPVAPAELPDGAGLALIVRLHGEPLGELVVEPADAAAGVTGWCEQAWAEFSAAITAHLRADGAPVPAGDSLGWAEVRPLVKQSAASCRQRPVAPQPAPSAALAVCTMGKHPLLPRCIQALLDQAYPGDFRVLVVDNATDSGLAAAVVAEFDDPRLELVSQPIPGLSFARNAAIAAATAAGAQLLLFTDDDAIADPGWLVAKAAVFGQDPGVSAVTGLIVPGSLASAAEQLFEEGSGFNKGYQRRVWSAAGAGASVWALGEKGDGGVLFPFAAGSFGSGNSLGFRTHVLTELGGFDTALGAGTLTAGGEDLDIFVRVIIAGGTIVYEPKAMVRHYHRETYAELQRQMVGYGSGLSAFLFRELLREPAARKQLLRVVPAGLRRMFDKSSEKNESRTSEYPKELARAEQIGFLKGPWLYLKATRRAKKMAAGDRG